MIVLIIWWWCLHCFCWSYRSCWIVNWKVHDLVICFTTKVISSMTKFQLSFATFFGITWTYCCLPFSMTHFFTYCSNSQIIIFWRPLLAPSTLHTEIHFSSSIVSVITVDFQFQFEMTQTSFSSICWIGAEEKEMICLPAYAPITANIPLLSLIEWRPWATFCWLDHGLVY